MDTEEKAQVKDISKKIKNGMRDDKSSKRHDKVQSILEEFRGIKSDREYQDKVEANSYQAHEKQGWRHRSKEEVYC